MRDSEIVPLRELGEIEDSAVSVGSPHNGFSLSLTPMGYHHSSNLHDTAKKIPLAKSKRD